MFQNPLAVLLLLAKNRKPFFLITGGCTMAALVFSLLVPIKYQATATLMPPVSQGTNLVSLMLKGNLMTDPEIGGTGYMPGMVTPSDIFGFMLKSSTVAGIVIKDCDLVDHYNKTKAFQKNPDKAMYDVAKKLNKATRIKVTVERFITITVEDKSRTKAAEIANCYGTALDRIYAKMNMTQGGNMREFIEKRVGQEESLLKTMEDSLKRFQQRYRTVSLTDEMKAVIDMSAQLEAKILSQQIELDAMKTYTALDNTQTRVMQNQIDKSKQELDNIMRGTKGNTLFIPFSKAPEILTRSSQLMREVRIHQELYVLLVQQLEQARILEAKDTPKVQFLEVATPPYRKSWPKRSLIVLMGILVGMIVGFISIVAVEWIGTMRSDVDANHQISEIIRVLSSR